MKKTLFEIRVFEEDNTIRSDVLVRHITIGKNKQEALGQLIRAVCKSCEALNIDPLEYLTMVGRSAEERKANG